MSSVHTELVRFLVVGVGSNLINFIVYFLAYAVGMPLLLRAPDIWPGCSLLLFWEKLGFNAGDIVSGRPPCVAFVYAIGGVGMVPS